MENSKTNSGESLNARHIWELPCIAIRVLLTHGMGEETLRAYVQDHVCEPCAGRLRDREVLLRLAHQACHSYNPLSQRLETQFNVRFRHQITWAREASYFMLAKKLATPDCTRFELLGLLWALLTDKSKLKRRFGADLLKALVVVEPPKAAQTGDNILHWPRVFRRDSADRHDLPTLN